MTRSSLEYARLRARPGAASEKSELLKKLRIEEIALDMCIIGEAASRAGGNPTVDPNRAKTEHEIKMIHEALDAITFPEKEKS